MSLSFSQNGFHLGDEDEATQADSTADFKVELNIIFVKTEEEMSETMLIGYEALIEKIPNIAQEYAKVMTVAECVNIPKAELKDEPKKIFIFDDFNETNAAFAYVSSVENVFIFGSKALISLVIEGVTSPNGVKQIHNMTMRECIVAATSLPRPKKKEIKKLVHYMGGKYFDSLVDKTTHLVCESIGSDKYEYAVKSGSIKIMHGDWVENVWKSSSKSTDVRQNLAKFDNFKLPAFFNLTITTTGLDPKKINEITTLVEENGGKYSSPFNQKCQVLIMPKEAMGEKKHKFAIKWKVWCLYPEWIYESAKLGYAANLEEFTLRSDTLKASTPTKRTVDTTVSNFNPDCTKLSEISRIPTLDDEDVSICATLASTSIRQTRSSMGRVAPQPSTSRDTEAEAAISKLGFTLRDARQVGLVLDGLHVYLEGFTKDARAELNKVLTALGALTNIEIDDGTTHVVVGTMSPELFSTIKDSGAHPIVVKFAWLQQVIARKAMISEKEFEIKNSTAVRTTIKPTEKPSPSSKKMMSSLSNGGFKKPAASKFTVFEDEPEPEDDLVGQYLEGPAPLQPNDTVEGMSTDNDEPDSSSIINRFLQGKNVFIYGFTTSESVEIIETCEEHGANLVDSSFKYEVDFIVTTNVVKSLDFPVKYKQLMSSAWLFECSAAQKLLDFELWSLPILQKLPIFEDERLVITNYKGNLRDWVRHLIQMMGGQAEFVINTAAGSYLLITDSEVGPKFQHTKKHGFAALPAEWLIACNRAQKRVDERTYLIGGTSPSEFNLKASPNRRESVVPSSQADNSFNFYDPPIENIEEPLPTTTCVTPNSSAVKRLLDDLPTPCRKVAESALRKPRAVQQPNSPRRRVLQNSAQKSPNTSSRDERSFRLRDDETPNTTRERKRRLAEMDKFYREPSQKVQRVDPESDLMEPSPPYRYQRSTEFYVNRQDDFKAASLGNDIPLPPTTVAATRLDFDSDLNNCTDFFAVPTQAPVPKKPTTSLQVMTEEYNSDPFKIDIRPPESDNMVTWDSGSQCAAKPKGPKKRYVFSFSFLADNVRTMLTQIVATLEAELTTGNDFTHLITPAPSKGEKYLSGIAKGVFLLHPSYLYKCRDVGRFVDEAEYEFGNPASSSTSFSQRIDTNMADAGYNWRNWISSNPDRFTSGAFTSVNFIMMNLPPDRIEQLANVVICGGGVKIDIDLATATVATIKRSKLQICFTEPKKTIKDDIKKKLTDAGVKILAHNRIFNFLVSKDIPSEL